MQTPTILDDDAVCAPCSDPRIAALLDAADRVVVIIDVTLAENESIVAPLRAGTTWSSPALVSA